ncbi:dihydrolipoyl dehydrogenase [Candidatus Bipolaricaulota bacterium]|nr:dihydrolipoyl dehydrogenase [Candidatus Bipolaricaulota bacterium]
MSSNSEKRKVVIIGAGPGGYAAAIRLGQYGLNPVVIEKAEIGGVCLNWGCIPTKALYSTTEPLGNLESWRGRGIELGDPSFDLEKIVNHQLEVVNSLTAGVEKLIESNGGEIVRGRARLFPGPKVRVEKNSGGELELNPDNVIVATGSAPIELPGFSFEEEGVWNSKQAVKPDEVPGKLVILGAGVIGLEMGTIYSRLGSEVEILEMEDGILPGMDLGRRFESFLSRELKKAGIKVHTETKAVEHREESGENLVVGEKDGEAKEYPADKTLVAVGRSPVLDVLAEDLDLGTDDKQYIPTDESCRTQKEGVFAIGDVAGPPLLAHKALRQGLIAAAAIAGEDIRGYKYVPSVVFSDPEYAEVGLSESKAKQEGYSPVVGSFPFRASGKALAMDATEGMVQLVVDEDSDRVLGGAVLGHNASDLISEIGLAAESGLTAREIAATIHAHPTLSEAVMEAAENVDGKAIHTSNR